MLLNNLKIIFDIFIFLGIFASVSLFIGYISKIHPLKAFLLKRKGELKEYDKLKQNKIKAKLRQGIYRNAFAQKKAKRKFSILEKTYIFIGKTAITTKFPSMSITDILLIYIGIFITLTIGIFFLTKSVLGVFIFAIFLLLATKLIGSAIIRGNCRKVDNQMNQFVNSCYCASDVTPNIIDIFGSIYKDMEYPLNNYLEECYLEAKQNRNTDLALLHLKEKNDSFIWRMIIDSFAQASKMNENYKKTIGALRPIIKRHDTVISNQNAIIRNTRVHLLVMFLIGIAILYFTSFFAPNTFHVLFDTVPGYIILGGIAFIIILGLTMQPKE